MPAGPALHPNPALPGFGPGAPRAWLGPCPRDLSPARCDRFPSIGFSAPVTQPPGSEPVTTRGQVDEGRSQADPALAQAILTSLAEAPAGLRVDELARAPSIARLRAAAPAILHALAVLHAAKAVRLGPLRRWQLVGREPSPSGRAAAARGAEGEVLRAIPCQVIRTEGTTRAGDPGDTQTAARGWSFAARYFRHAARMLAAEERARSDVFADRAAETVQLVRTVEPWWPDPDGRTLLRLSRRLLAHPFQAALARRDEDEIDLVWGLRVRMPRGAEVPIWTPLVVWPAVWRLAGEQIEVEPASPLPSLDLEPLPVRGRAERERIAAWLGLAADDEEGAVPIVEPPELGTRLGPLLRDAPVDPLDPLAPRAFFPLAAAEGVYNVLAIVLRDRTRYGRGATAELRELAELAERREWEGTALATLFDEVGRATAPGRLFEPIELSGSQLDAARDASVQPLTVITGPPAPASRRWWPPSPPRPPSRAKRCSWRAATTGPSTRSRNACAR